MIMFEACNDRSNPDSHWQLDPLCRICDEPEDSYKHGELYHGRHDFIAPENPVFGENAWRKNACPFFSQVEPSEDAPEGIIHCSCPCHWSNYYVNVYAMDRAYGGPEEGGWWYDYGIPVASMPFDSYKEAEEYRESIRTKFPRTGKRNSVIHDGEDDYDIILERHFATKFPEKTPRYQ